jgi:hypothetical protein
MGYTIRSHIPISLTEKLMAHLVLIENDNGDVVDQEVYCSDFCAKQSEHYAGWNGCNEIGFNEPCAECGVELAGVNE